MKKWKKLLFAAVPMTMALSFTSLAGEWHEDMVGWWYENDDGSCLKNGWHWVDGDGDGRAECYYFNLRGYVVDDFGQADGYEINKDGAWTVNGEVQTKKVSLPNDSEAMAIYLASVEKNGELDSLDAVMKADIAMDLDGESTEMTMDISMKMRGAKAGDLEYVMEGSMSMMGLDMPFSSFYTDGYVYTESMEMKIKEPTTVYEAIEEAKQTMEFTNVEQSMITNMKMRQDGENTVLTYSMNRADMNDFLNEMMGMEAFASLEEFGFKVGYDIRKADGEVVIDQNGYYTKENVSIDVVMTMTDIESGDSESFGYQMNMELNINNPGEPVEFTLPSTEGYTELTKLFTESFENVTEI